MIPIQVKLDGFMSYRDEAVLRFAGAELWMLCGRNGAGKSTIFDAMKFALFGTHRDGSQGAEVLVHHEKDALQVEFDFQVNDDIFRVRRTLKRGARPTFQAFHVAGPNPPRLNAPAPQAVPETDSRDGLRRWIESHIGLSEQTFSAAVLLQQGKSDALLTAKNEDRHALLTEIIDLSAYENLHERTDEKRKEFESAAKSLRTQLEHKPAVDTSQIARLAEQVASLSGTLDETRCALEEILSLQVHARQWQQAVQQHTSITSKLAHARELLINATIVERGAARLDELEVVLPRLGYALQERSRRAASHSRQVALQKSILTLQEQAEHARARQESLAERSAELQGASEQWEHTRQAANETCLRLTPVLHDLEERDRLQSQLRHIDEQIASYPANLEEAVEQVESEVALLRSHQLALPHLRHFTVARTAWNQSLSIWHNTQNTLANLAQSRCCQEAAQLATQEHYRQAAAALEAAQQEEVRERTRLEDVQERQIRFEQVEGAATCDYCGQELSIAHRTAERQRLREALTQAESRYAQRQQALATARSRYHDAVRAVQELEAQVENVCLQEKVAQERLHQAWREGASWGEQAMEALRELAPDYVQRICHAAQDNRTTAESALHTMPIGAELDNCEAMTDYGANLEQEVRSALRSSYPTPQDLATLSAQVQGLKERALHLAHLQEQYRQRDAKRNQREPIEQRCTELESRYSDAQAESLRQQHAVAQAKTEQAQRELTALRSQVQENQTTLKEAAATFQETQRQVSEVGTKAAAEAATQAEIDQNLARVRGELPEAWHSVFEGVSEASMRQWREEQRHLEAHQVRQKLQELTGARHQITALEEQLQQVNVAISVVPEAARRSVEELEVTEQSMRHQIEQTQNTLTHTRQQQDQLELQYQARQELEERALLAERSARHHKLLAEALGRDALQHHLLQEAEETIVEGANQVLDRISSGTLRLELRRDEAAEMPLPGTRRGAVKALDLVAYHSASGAGTKPLPVSFLSGSQRFRVAVSLALGIGHYAMQGTRRVESVIIDEGFGSLDREGRHEMIEELHALQNVLKRIILVSHQEEFSDAFSNRYLIQLQDGTSRASLQEPT